MEARASFRHARIPSGVVLLFVAALLAALVLGGAGGYLVRALTAPSNVTTTTVDTTVPRYTEGIPTSPACPAAGRRPAAAVLNSSRRWWWTASAAPIS